MRARLLAILVAALPFASAAAAPAPRPNVLFIAVDDLRPQLGCYGDDRILTPNIDRLAERSLRFNRAYCQQAICMSSRASLLTGHRPDTGEIYRNQAVAVHVPNALTLNQHFTNNGYRTVSMGKIYHYGQDRKRGWTEKHFSPKEGKDPRGNWYGRGYLTPAAMAQAREHDRTHKKGRQGMGPAFEAADVADDAYPDGLTAKHAIAELNRLKDQPFFMAVGFSKPHLPFNAPQRYWDLYDPDAIRLADNPFAPKNSPDVAHTPWGELRGYYGMPKEGPMPDDLARQLTHGYYACTSYADALIGSVLDELDRLDLAKNTIVILWGDHGFKLGDHGMWCKHTNFELDTRVPLILSVPGRDTAGHATNALVELVDVYPTLCELCGLDLPSHLEGASAAPLVDDPTRPWKKAAFSQYFWKKPGVLGHSIRTRDHRYTEWRSQKDDSLLARELYDHTTDPAENQNVVDAPAHAELAAQLAKHLHAGPQAAKP